MRFESTYKRLLVAFLAVAALSAIAVFSQMALKGSFQSMLPWNFRRKQTATEASFLTHYGKCKDTVIDRCEIPGDIDSYILSVNEKGQEGWILSSRGEKSVEFLREVDDYCPEHARFRYIVLNQGYVCVYRGKRKDPAFLHREYTKITESSIVSPKDKELLRAGFVLEDDPSEVDGKVSKYLEGLIED